MSMAVVGSDGTAGEPSLADRVLSVVSKRGSVGILGDELLRKLGVDYDAMMAVVDQYQSCGPVRVHWSMPECLRVVCTG